MAEYSECCVCRYTHLFQLKLETAHYCFLSLSLSVFLSKHNHLLNCAISYSNGYTPLIQLPMMNGGLREREREHVWVVEQERVFKFTESRLRDSALYFTLIAQHAEEGGRRRRGSRKPFSLLTLHFKFKKITI